MNEIKKDLIKARDYKDEGRYEKALEYFKKVYDADSDALKDIQKEDYAWTIYRTKIQNFKDEDELLEHAQFVTEMLPQGDLNERTNCPYTSTVFKVLNHFEDVEDYYSMIFWLEKLDYELLDEKPYRKYGRLNKSKKEKYLDWASKAYLKTMDFEKCIGISKIALDTFDTFLDEGDVWLKWRIAKSLMGLNRFREALEYYLEVIEFRHDWYMYRDIAEIYYNLRKPYVALDYLCPAVLSEESNLTKVNLYCLCYNVFKSFNREMALKHAQLYCILRKERNYPIPDEIEMLGIDETVIDKIELEEEIRELWVQYRFKDQKIKHGVVNSYDPNKKHGYIQDDDDEMVFFAKSDFDGGDVYVGQMVSFYTESLNDAKNVNSVKAVNVRGK